MTSKPNVLIFGGMNGLAPILALHLVSLSEEPRVSHLRIVDKYSMHPPTTYAFKDFLRLLQEKKDLVEYRQTNLTRQDSIEKSFTDPSPNNEPYTHVIDLTGELPFDRSPEIFISQAFNISLSIAREASKHGIKSYVHHIPAYYEHLDGEVYKEEDAEGWKPWGNKGIWKHESIRAIGNIPNLPLVVIRAGATYGPGEVRSGTSAVVLLMALVYRQLGEELMFMGSPQLRRHIVYTLDWAGAMWATSLWAADKPRSTLNQLAGVNVPPSGDKLVDETEGTVKRSEGGVMIPVFNLTDESDLKQEKMAAVLSNVFGIKTGFPDDVFSGFKPEEALPFINAKHYDAWVQIIQNANPPVPSTPLSPMLAVHEVQPNGCSMDSSKLRTIVGYTFKYPQFNEDTVRQTVESWQAEGIWPNTNLYPPS